MKTVIILFAVCLGVVVSQFMPQPMPMGMPMGMNGMGPQQDYQGGPPGFNPMGFNPYMGPNMPAARNMNVNQQRQDNNRQGAENDSTADKDKDKKDNKEKPKEQPRSNTNDMLDNMGLHGIQDFYAALTGELARNPSGYQYNANAGAPRESLNYRRRK
ncbi:uncharacterized protein LOC129598547 [Paramacrobiotus metropolitanus]|uniref:uncharacterized protein LOC129598547 n=1 Tax=Paramacrobiotus metropolitanus TaxID=2943436 RepID=UPI002446267C|nr:uncharacterized protein LOC129598547 [Paramacrobiotus metropolitanus]